LDIQECETMIFVNSNNNNYTMKIDKAL